ncbi:MAG: HD domain-containing protein [Bacilli bacterium]|nr:HD domain-containing protein [Bacilli bacterium]
MNETILKEGAFSTDRYISIMEKLLLVVQELSASKDLTQVMNIVRHSIRDLLESDGATFVLLDNDMCYYAEEDAISPLWKGKRFPMDICISGWVMKNKIPAVIKDIYQDERIPIDAYRKTFVRGLIAVPIRTHDPIGAIGCYWADNHAASPEEVRVLQVLADTAAIAMGNIHFQEIIDEKAQQLEKAVENTLQVISNIVEQKDLYTSGHQQRVAKIAMDIATELKWEKETCEMIYRAGIIHDIGKIGIPSETLSKPAKLTFYEYEFIKTHSEQGYNMLKNIPFFEQIAEIILEHHERLDGSGYPRKLKGDEILPEARVLAVADVFEAMTSHRPYRPALGLEVAMDELISNRGILYCANAVDALTDLVRNKGYHAPV